MKNKAKRPQKFYKNLFKYPKNFLKSDYSFATFEAILDK